MSKFKTLSHCATIRDYLAATERDGRWRQTSTVVLTKRERCRACGQLIAAGETAIQHLYDRGGAVRWNRNIYLHLRDCCPITPPPPRCGWCGKPCSAEVEFCGEGCAEAYHERRLYFANLIANTPHPAA